MSETIVITGATGVIGWRAVAELLAAGHRVTGVTRSVRGRAMLGSMGADAVEADVFDEAALGAAFAGASVVVNLLTHVPPSTRILLPRAWEEHNRLRREASRAVARAAQAVGAHRLVQESLAFVYADGGDRWLDEDAPLDASGASASALVAERNAREEFGGDTVVLRFGTFVGPDSELSRADVAHARRGVSPFRGDRDAYVPTVWLDDAGAAVGAALRVPAGSYNVVDDDPPTRAEVDGALAAAVGRQRLADPAGETPPALRALARSLRLSNRRLREHGGWAPQVRGGVDGWRLVARQAAAA
jgi:nucleoside-diphosphate-sugar epimerase